jgi:hypothetical protein
MGVSNSSATLGAFGIGAGNGCTPPLKYSPLLSSFNTVPSRAGTGVAGEGMLIVREDGDDDADVGTTFGEACGGDRNDD